jgi:hypothetical protein
MKMSGSFNFHYIKSLSLNYVFFVKEALATILTKKIMFWKLVNSFKMMK